MTTAPPRYLTKSRFKLALECPTKLFYTGKPEYANQKIDDPFLLALAKGGFQVGELAKCYFPGGVEVKTDHGDYAGAIVETNALLGQKNAIIFEAAVSFASLFIRVDILVKTGTNIEIIEVKSKSYEEGKKPFFGARGSIDSGWKPYLYDVAFQKYVVQNAFPAYTVSASLMLADKGSLCPTDGLHQKFRIKTNEKGRKYAEIAGTLTDEELNSQILCKVNVDAECDRIFAGTDTSPASDVIFADRISFFSDHYSRDERITHPIASGCKTCEFQSSAEDKAAGLLGGYNECWSAQLGWTDADFKVPSVLDVWDFRVKDKMIAGGKIKLSEFAIEDIGTKTSEKSGLSRNERQWMQVEKACSGETSHYIDTENLKKEMASWKFPLHFIDFETATPAIPLNKGRRPYEEIAFQFSHHTVDNAGRVEHKGQYLNAEIGVFPNYDFLRALRDELSGDDGTIFRYASHENTYLNAIYRQLREDPALIPDREDLCDFIKTISKSKTGSTEAWEGERNMVDLLDMVKRFFYHPSTRGSNSIKKVLPAILNCSDFLKAKYASPVYGTQIPSLNFKSGWTWVEFDGASVKDPYSRLPKLFASEIFDALSDEDEELKDGGAAMTAYCRIQFEDMLPEERMRIRNGLLRYCELDTLAMVMIYEGWREMVG